MSNTDPVLVENSFEDEIINIGTRTALKLLSLGSEPLSLYVFYCITAKRQSIALRKRIVTIRATETYCMAALGWGQLKFRNAKKILLDQELIKNVVKKTDEGKIIGYYIQINYVPIETSGLKNQSLDKTSRWMTPRVDESTPNTDIYNNINTDKKNNALSPISPIGVSSKPSLITDPIEHKKSSKNSILPLTPIERWELAKTLDIPLHEVVTMEKNFWQWYEQQTPAKKKRYKTSYRTIENWLDRRLSSGELKNCSETEKLQLEMDHPEKVAEHEAIVKLAREKGLID